MQTKQQLWDDLTLMNSEKHNSLSLMKFKK